jgi:hypothetical protein
MVPRKRTKVFLLLFLQKKKTLHLSLAVSAVLAAPAMAREVPEHLVQKIPAGFTEVTNRKQTGMVLHEYVPAGENLHDWTSKITTQEFPSGDPPPPARYLSFLAQSWKDACPAAPPPQTGTGFDTSGRSAGSAEFDCPDNPATHKPEHTYFQIIRGASALYVAQYAFRREPGPAQTADAVAYLGSVHLEGTAPSHPQ